jgi:hypothetical protein
VPFVVSTVVKIDIEPTLIAGKRTRPRYRALQPGIGILVDAIDKPVHQRALLLVMQHEQTVGDP